MNYEEFIRNRITKLRMLKNVSEYQMSLDLGHSKSYIQSISSGRALPSMSEFISICEYLGVTPKEFFDDENSNPVLHGLRRFPNMPRLKTRQTKNLTFFRSKI